ncbi:hypothetical protein MUN89_07710 [Halobacillus salinarum]|uniref:Lipoprotein n=1 Tax=Halobacillus salinarum TaxID=2932257 RepID=A0ABY4EMW6_9BACI|nr:hypothetical protein [Halobacillus salinarum]UOQ45805.1 hypothetical protein MUN89_07710 [Halobacillus salinarum]
MKWFTTLVVVMLLLAACTNQGSSESKQKNAGASSQEVSASILKVKPANLSEREKTLVNQMGNDHQTFYTVDGEVKEGDVLVTSVQVYKKGEKGEEVMSSVGSGEEKKFNKALHSFQIQLEKKAAYVTIGSPNGYARGSTTIPGDIGSFLFEQPGEEIKLIKGKPIYLAYLIGTSKNTLTTPLHEDLTTLPKSVKDAEFALVFILELKDEES